MTRFTPKHSSLHPICAILVKYKDGTHKRLEFGSKAELGQALMWLYGKDDVEGVEEVKL